MTPRPDCQHALLVWTLHPAALTSDLPCLTACTLPPGHHDRSAAACPALPCCSLQFMAPHKLSTLKCCAVCRLSANSNCCTACLQVTLSSKAASHTAAARAAVHGHTTRSYDQIIMAKQAGGPRPRGPGAAGDDN